MHTSHTITAITFTPITIIYEVELLKHIIVYSEVTDAIKGASNKKDPAHCALNSTAYGDVEENHKYEYSPISTRQNIGDIFPFEL